MKFLLCMAVLFFFAMRVWPLDFSIRARPFLSIPVGSSNKHPDTGDDLYTLGGGGDAIFDIDISSIITNPLSIGYSAGPIISYGIVPVKSTDTSLQLVGGGLGLSLFYHFGRVAVRGGMDMGIFQGLINDETLPNTWWGYNAEAGFRFSPSIILSAWGGYRHFSYQIGNPLHTGIVAGLSLQFSFETGKNDDGVEVEYRQDESVFPVFSGLYRDNQVGVLRLRNRESAEIRNVRVYFRAGDYTASEMLCAVIGRISKNRVSEIPLYADFSPRLFSLSENGQIPGEVRIEYELLGSPRTALGQALVSVYNRNAFRWNNPASLAVFVSPQEPEVLDYTRYLIGIARNRLRTGLNQNMQYAVYLFEGLRAGNISWSADHQTPYSTYHRNNQAVDYIQFPFQTLAYRSGDLDDLALLYAASLEAAGIPAALIPLDDDFVVACNLGIDREQAESFFSDLDSLLFVNNETWLPVAFSGLKEGFINSWYTAVNQLNAAFETGVNIDMVILQDAWTLYPPAAIASQSAQFEKPGEDALFRMVETDMRRYIASEFGPKIQAVIGEIRSLGPSAARYNQLGLLYVRSGMYAEASAEYQRAAAMGSVPAMVNLGNLAVMVRNFSVAEQWYARALQADPANRAAQNGMNRIVDRSLD
jgi:TPR repeat protein